MGIDVYLSWDNMSEADKKAQITGFSVTHGHTGYLREAYHGGPYATAYLFTEDWDDQPEEGFAIPATELKARLPGAVMAALYRQHLVYEGEARGNGQLKDALKDIFDNMSRVQDRDYHPNDEQARAIAQLIEARRLPDYALAFVDFVRLAEKKESETGKPCRVIVSH